MPFVSFGKELFADLPIQRKLEENDMDSRLVMVESETNGSILRRKSLKTSSSLSNPKKPTRFLTLFSSWIDGFQRPDRHRRRRTDPGLRLWPNNRGDSQETAKKVK